MGAAAAAVSPLSPMSRVKKRSLVNKLDELQSRGRSEWPSVTSLGACQQHLRGKIIQFPYDIHEPACMSSKAGKFFRAQTSSFLVAPFNLSK